ncbi:MAG: LysR family transcriptional regulator [Planctomycetes bacterium]|nr:LysR family transcriptional regulator [Planctomycetota bacterium]
MNWLNFRHLYAFWTVAREGSFTHAASQMYVAQSAVSSQVAALESYLKVQLLVRTNRSVELTPAGRELMGYANSIFAQSRAINALIKDRQSLPEHRSLKVGVVGGASRNFVYRLLDDYAHKAPGAHVSVSTGSYAELYELLRRFRLDAIVTLDPPKKKDMSEVSYRKLGESSMCVVAVPALIAKVSRARTGKRRTQKAAGKKAAKRAPARRRRPKEGAAAKERVDVFKFRHPFEVDVIERHVRPVVDCELNLRLDTDDIPLLRFFANSGKGLAVLPRVGVLEDLEAGAVEAIELPDCPEVIIYGITMNQARPAFGGGPLGLWPGVSESERG